MASNVRFMFGTKAKYDALETKEPLALYFITDEATGEFLLYKGDNLYAKGNEATSAVSGLMSAADKVKLDTLVSSGSSGYVAADGSIVVENDSIKVAISAEAGNTLSLKSDGLFVSEVGTVEVPEYAIEKQEVADAGNAATYKLKMTLNGENFYVGDAINIPTDLVISSGVLDTVGEANVPYDGAVVGDPFLDITLSNEAADHIYIPVKGLVDTYKAGDGLQLTNGTFSVKVDAESNGLTVVDGSLGMLLASDTQNGAMSKEMFTAVNGLLDLGIEDNYATKADLQAVAGNLYVPNAEQFDVQDGVFTLSNIDADKVIYNGQKLSDVLSNVENVYIWEELPDVVTASAENAAAAILSASDGAVVQMSAGTVAETVTVNKSATINGDNAGVAQNFSQEV